MKLNDNTKAMNFKFVTTVICERGARRDERALF